MAGYIKLYRDIQFNKIWQEKPFTRGQAWVDMLLRCNHVCVQMPPQYQNIWVLRGQFLSSNIKLGEYWGWGECKVRRFMEYLETDKMITYIPKNKYTVYEILKYAELQALESELYEAASDEQKTSRKRTKNEQKTTNNNDKNNKNDKKLKDIGEMTSDFTQDEKLKIAINDFVNMRIVKKKEPTQRAMELIFMTLKPYNIDTQIKMLEKSIINQWTDVYPLKELSKQQSKGGNPFLEKLKEMQNEQD
jgi:hypothetical protein